jgi:hypothetical protein
MKSFKAWLVVDDEGTYVPTLHMTRREAQTEIKDQQFLRDAKWRVVHVKLSPVR